MAGWKTNRGRIYSVYGPPNEKESHPTGGVYQQPGASSLVKFPSQKWMYRLRRA